MPIRFVVQGTSGVMRFRGSTSMRYHLRNWSVVKRFQSSFCAWTDCSPMGEGDSIWLQSV